MDKKVIRKEFVGNVISDKMNKTVIVQVEELKRHPVYKKTIRSVAKFKSHDEKNESKVGDLVRIVETRPLSKEKRWRVAQILKKAEVIEIKPTEVK